MMSFKTYLSTQDDTITDEDAIKKYAEYKLEFKRQQLNDFFVAHKDEEWCVSDLETNLFSAGFHVSVILQTAHILSGAFTSSFLSIATRDQC